MVTSKRPPSFGSVSACAAAIAAQPPPTTATFTRALGSTTRDGREGPLHQEQSPVRAWALSQTCSPQGLAVRVRRILRLAVDDGDAPAQAEHLRHPVAIEHVLLSRERQHSI